jgi:hypothetical protein
VARLNKFTCRLNDETVRQLEEIKESKYPKADDRTKVIKWLIEDTYEEIQKGNEVRIGVDRTQDFRGKQE